MYAIYKLFGFAGEVRKQMVKDIKLSINRWQINIKTAILFGLFLITLASFLLHIL